MSFGLCFNAPVCGHCHRGGDTVWSRSHTYRLQPMWKAAGLPFDDKIEGKCVTEILPSLEAGLAELKRDHQKYRALSQTNNWGTYEDLIEVTESAIAAAKQFPTATISTWA